jgi:ribose transport system permease protein
VLGTVLNRNSYAVVPTAIAAVLFIVNAVVQPSFIDPGNWAPILAVSSPFILIALAEAPPVLSGNGGLDLSVGPFAGFVTVFVAAVLVPAGLGAPEVLIPVVIGFGLAAGGVVGVLIAYVRLPPIIATLGAYLFYTGMASQVLPSPGGVVPPWLIKLDGSYGPIPGLWIVFTVVAAGWMLLSRTAYLRNLLAVGGAAYTAGMNTAMVKVLAYAIAGMLAALAGLILAGVIESGDATIGPGFTITAIAAVALGGVSLAGGRGGLFGAAMGGAVMYLVQSLLTVAHVSVYQLNIADGLILVLALALNGMLERLRKRGGRSLAHQVVADTTVATAESL